MKSKIKVLEKAVQEMGDNLDILKKLTERLHSTPEMLEHPTVLPSFVIRAENSPEPILVRTIFRNENMHIMRCYCPAGSEHPQHVHNVQEVVLVGRGKINLVLNGEEKIIGQHEIFVVPADVPHACFFKENTELTAITIPPAKEYTHDA